LKIPFGVAQYTKGATGDHGLNRGGDMTLEGAAGRCGRSSVQKCPVALPLLPRVASGEADQQAN
jgi:hypothetical protein